MSAGGAGLFLGSAVVCVVIVALFGYAAGWFYLAGIVAGPSVYMHRWPWQL